MACPISFTFNLLIRVLSASELFVDRKESGLSSSVTDITSKTSSHQLGLILQNFIRCAPWINSASPDQIGIHLQGQSWELTTGTTLDLQKWKRKPRLGSLLSRNPPRKEKNINRLSWIFNMLPILPIPKGCRTGCFIYTSKLLHFS